jgi:signal transduction histidine kinase/ligand-binding sensor domain-containing protein/AraC-like DNA-binding protein
MDWKRLIFKYVSFIFLSTLFMNSFGQNRSFLHYTPSDGLPYSSITDFTQSPDGFIWISTRLSVCRFDGYRFEEIPALNRQGDPEILRTPKLLSDGKGTVFIYANYKLFRYDSVSNRAQECHFSLDQVEFKNLSPAGADGLWVSYPDSLVHIRFDGNTPVSAVSVQLVNTLTGVDKKLLVAREIDSTLFMLFSDQRIVSYSLNDQSVQTYSFDFPLDKDLGLMYIDHFHNLWVSMDIQGLLRINLKSGVSDLFTSESKGFHHLPHNLVRCITEDLTGNLWVGTEKGLCILNLKESTSEIELASIQNPKGLNSNAIYALFCDREGDVWVGTYFGGINLWNSKAEFFKTITAGQDSYSLTDKEIGHISEDSRGRIWIGLEGGGINVLDPKTGLIQTYKHKPGVNSLSYDNVHSIQEGPDNLIYIGTYTGGLNRFDPRTGLFSSITDTKPDPMPSRNIYCLYPAGDSIWIGTDNGIAIYYPHNDSLRLFEPVIFKSQIIESILETDTEIWISCRHCIFIFDKGSQSFKLFDKFAIKISVSFLTADSRGNIWIGDSFSGLFRYSPTTDSISHYWIGNGFPANRVFGLLEGSGGWYWVSSAKGLIKFQPETGELILYNSDSGLPFSQFNSRAFYKDQLNNFYFGGINGLVVFNEKGVAGKTISRPVAFSKLEVFGRKVESGEGSPIVGSLNGNRNIVLPFREKMFTVHYSALDFIHPGRIQYSYFLEGFNSAWIQAGNQTSVTYTNLSPGRYRLHVKSANENNEWSPEYSILNIRIKPPLYLTAGAFVFYLFVLVGSLMLFYLFSTKMEKVKSSVALERTQKEHLDKLNRVKLEYFTNIAHELRTPLNLIIAPLSKLLKEREVNESFWLKIKHIQDNSQRLLSLINQILEFRKIESGAAKLEVCKGNIALFVREISDAFMDVAELRNIKFTLLVHCRDEMAWFDHSRMERILFNLLSNAFKYTQNNGTISLKVTSSFDPLTQKGLLDFQVTDNGIGMSAKTLSELFKRYPETGFTGMRQGSMGIGLAFTKSLVDLHMGEIRVESFENQGSTFSVRIPCGFSDYGVQDIISEKCQYSTLSSEWIEAEFPIINSITEDYDHEGKPIVLIVDDNFELLSFLKENLAGSFQVLTAMDGQSAWVKIEEELPDIIVSDVIMPIMDGIALTQKIKSTLETSHIPVILLSSKVEVEFKFEGLSSGADFYMEKPFYPEILIKQIENILTTRNKLIESFKNNIEVEPAEIAHSQSDRDFLEKLTHIIMENLDNPDLDVSFLTSGINMSRTLLHVKLKKLTGCSATGVIRMIRLKEAAKMLRSCGTNISEIAYSTGFSSPAFFSRRFKEHFGISPKEFGNRPN